MSINKKLIISVLEARKLLGKDYANYSDCEIEELINSLDLIAKSFFESVPKM